MLTVEFCTREEKLQALERALASRTFARSDQLRSFLRFVCDAESKGESQTLTEYLIGVEVLHRPANYSPAEDSSVRTRAYELRHKLERLYTSELTDDPWQIVIPKGSYAPQFRRAPELPPPQTIPAGAPTPAPLKLLGFAPGRHRRPVIVLAALAAACCAGLLLGGWMRGRVSSAISPVVAEAWRPFAAAHDAVLLVPATPLYLVFGPETHSAYGSPTYPAPPEAYPWFAEHRPLRPGQKLGMVFTNDALGVGSMNAVLLAAETLHALGAAAQILPERPAMMSLLHGRDAILFGAPVDSRAIADLLEKTPLSVVYDDGLKEFVVRDRSSGQRFVPEKEANGDFRSVYGLVTVLDTRESGSSRLGMLVFSGVTSVGTHGAAEYFTSPQSLTALRDIFAKEGIRGFPPAYQIVVKCRFEDMLLVGYEYAAHRVIRRD